MSADYEDQFSCANNTIMVIGDLLTSINTSQCDLSDDTLQNAGLILCREAKKLNDIFYKVYKVKPGRNS